MFQNITTTNKSQLNQGKRMINKYNIHEILGLKKIMVGANMGLVKIKIKIKNCL